MIAMGCFCPKPLKLYRFILLAQHTEGTPSLARLQLSGWFSRQGQKLDTVACFGQIKRMSLGKLARWYTMLGMKVAMHHRGSARLNLDLRQRWPSWHSPMALFHFRMRFWTSFQLVAINTSRLWSWRRLWLRNLEQQSQNLRQFLLGDPFHVLLGDLIGQLMVASAPPTKRRSSNWKMCVPHPCHWAGWL